MRAAPITLALVLAIVAAAAPRAAHGDPDPKRKLIVLEYRAGSSALPGIATRMVSLLSRSTSLQVLGPDQARTVYGDQLDQVLVRCGGEATCISRIGQKVGAAEVILVGISELGDVILTMQRIEVASRSVASRVADSLAAGRARRRDRAGQAEHDQRRAHHFFPNRNVMELMW